MKYILKIKHSAEKELDGLSQEIYQRLVRHILVLAENPRPYGVKKLREKVYRIRVGDYRVVYLVDDQEKVVEIVKVGHRREIYR